MDEIILVDRVILSLVLQYLILNPIRLDFYLRILQLSIQALLH